MGLKYCKNCEQMVTPSKQFNWLAFIILSIVSVGLLGLVYLLYYAFSKEKCPLCNSENWGSPPSKKR